jgi:hypothetical protein
MCGRRASTETHSVTPSNSAPHCATAAPRRNSTVRYRTRPHGTCTPQDHTQQRAATKKLRREVREGGLLRNAGRPRTP